MGSWVCPKSEVVADFLVLVSLEFEVFVNGVVCLSHVTKHSCLGLGQVPLLLFFIPYIRSVRGFSLFWSLEIQGLLELSGCLALTVSSYPEA